jgi:sugar/nucleoside kinase (ribokinase family)
VIKDNQNVQQVMQTGAVDIMFMSDREFQTIVKTQEGQKSLDAVDTIVVTKGSEGCFIRSHLKSTTFEYTTPSFARITSVRNDNGAGETHHNNFLATFTAVHPELRGNADLKFKMDVIHTAARIGNLAAYIKIQQDQSLWFPDLDFNLIRDELIKGSASPEDIAKLVLEEYRGGGRLH